MENKGNKYDKRYFEEKHEGHPEDNAAVLSTSNNNSKPTVTSASQSKAPEVNKSTLDELIGVRHLMQMKLKAESSPSKPGTFGNQEWFLKFASKDEATLIKRSSTSGSYGISHGKTYTFGSLNEIEWVKEAG